LVVRLAEEMVVLMVGPLDTSLVDNLVSKKAVAMAALTVEVKDL
jgi:hypothetical protein